MVKSYELAADEVVFTLNPPEIPAGVSENSASIIGQMRALTALSMGLGIHSRGYNIFIMGQHGTGRRTALLKALESWEGRPEELRDIVYVNNFSNKWEPIALYFPAGKAQDFKKGLHSFIEDIKELVAVHESSELFRKVKKDLEDAQEKEENARLASFEERVAGEGFRIVQVAGDEQSATDILPLVDGEVASFESLQEKVANGTFEQAKWNSLRETYYVLVDSMKELFVRMRRERASLERKVDDARKEGLLPQVRSQAAGLQTQFADSAVHEWLESLVCDVADHLFLFSRERLEAEQNRRRKRAPALSRYGVNILHAAGTKAPVVFENRPTLAKLVGSIDPGSDPSSPGYLNIRGGAILRALGGVLVIRVEDIVEDEDAWPYLKRILQTGTLEIVAGSGPLAPPVTLKPAPVEVNFKLVLIGGELSYDLLYQHDEEFPKLFKVCAEFDDSMPRTGESELRFVEFLHHSVEKDSLRALTPDGERAVLEYGVRLAGHRQLLTTRFSLISDLLREANWWASQDEREALDGTAIARALEMRAYIHSQPEEKIRESILDGDIILDVEGTALAKANGLAVLDRGYYSFGIPVVVSARVAPGDGGVMNIEGLSGLSGEIFDKAVLILSGYLRSRYARDFPLSITASLCFEQSYTAIDGDSATIVQLCALISAIAGIPLRQDLAVTGSVNQFGDIQPVGGISEKIEGFFTICEQKGLTGTQGVIIPRRNLPNLILNDHIESLVSAGRFHIYAVNSIDEALEVLCGEPAGVPGPDGQFPPETLNGRVYRELKAMAEIIHQYET